jgi:hypothetical protein
MAHLTNIAKRLVRRGTDEVYTLEALQMADAIGVAVLGRNESFAGVLEDAKRLTNIETKAARRSALQSLRDYPTKDRASLFDAIVEKLRDEHLDWEQEYIINIVGSARQDFDKAADQQPIRKLAMFPDQKPPCVTCGEKPGTEMYLNGQTLEIAPMCSGCASASWRSA